MANMIVDGERMRVEDVVLHYSSDMWSMSSGKLEALQEELTNTRKILARVVDALANKRVFNDNDELLKIIRGY